MRFTSLFFIVAAIVLVLVAFTPQSSEGSRRKIMKLKKLAVAALLLKGKKKILFPLPIPLALPLPLLKAHQPIVHAEPWPEPLAEPVLVGHGHGHGHFGHGFGHGLDFGGLW